MGIRQGDSLSSVLSNVVIDEIILQVREVDAGFGMGEKTGKILCYANNAILMAQSEDELQRLLYRFTRASNELSMEISALKTKSIVISK